ncbi:class I SAM-dependent methyltransferase [Chromobacterium sp. IIBBL 290-4]|uniref:class I SAM-dependent methyltransferase n=1 Tax=Chromobacterium sp. IIBBL 290-4 TaxID=2953890 RepID=UPI0020B69CE3|nr:class I SAM-dependent methyltransferase [Chromobacterium sp. IIBBL 290-4]UTH75826.1 class I SAM-dependent methyltransferase [Chromobacterium sp. IIBBL 290-4]
MFKLDATKLHDTPPEHCSICQAAGVDAFGEKDFGHAGNDHFIQARTYPDYGVMVPYHHCHRCGFVFSALFDRWQDKDFLENVYNDDYHLSDPPFLEERPSNNSRLVASLFESVFKQGEVLDYGGGNGLLSTLLRQRDIDAYSYDPHFGEVDVFPSGKTFDLVTAFEVIEHVPHLKQRALMEHLSSFLHADRMSMALLSTETIAAQAGIDWWYICPRNGHISIHSEDSLQFLAACFDLSLLPAGNSLYALCRPEWEDRLADSLARWRVKPAVSAASVAGD